MSTSRRSPASLMAAAGESTAVASAPTAKRRRRATGSSTPPSMTAPGWPTPRSSPTNKPSPPPVLAASTPGSPPRDHRRASAHRQRVLLPIQAVATALAETGVTPKRTRPYRPQTNGKVERFHRILLEEWAYIRPWRSDHQRSAAYDGFIHFYNRTDPTAHSAGQPRPTPSTASAGTTSPASTGWVIDDVVLIADFDGPTRLNRAHGGTTPGPALAGAAGDRRRNRVTGVGAGDVVPGSNDPPTGGDVAVGHDDSVAWRGVRGQCRDRRGRHDGHVGNDRGEVDDLFDVGDDEQARVRLVLERARERCRFGAVDQPCVGTEFVRLAPVQ